MKKRIEKRKVALEQTNKDNLSAVRHIIECVFHRLRIACGIHHHRRQIASKHFSYFFYYISRFCIDNPIYIHPYFTEAEPLLIDIHDHHLRSPGFRKLYGCQSYGAGADHQHQVVFAYVGTIYCVAANCQRLDECELVVAKARGFVQVLCRQLNSFPHSTVFVYSKNRDVFPAIGLSPPHRLVLLVVKIGFHRTFIAHRYVLDISSYLYHFHT